MPEEVVAEKVEEEVIEDVEKQIVKEVKEKHESGVQVLGYKDREILYKYFT